MSKLIACLLLFLFAPSSHAASNDALVSWDAPTKNTDGSALTNLATYRVSYGKTRGGPYTQQITVPATQTSVRITPPSGGTWYFVVKALNSSGVESASSNEGSKLIRPAAPTDGSIQAPTDGSIVH